MDTDKIQQAVRMILEAIGEDSQREGLRDTPRRVAQMYQEIFSGLNDEKVWDELFVEFDEKHDEMVVVKDIPFYSICEHHLLPFYGKAHVAYIPKGRITGLSKLARAVDIMSRRPQTQERLTAQVADIIMQRLDPYAVAVVVEAEHLCMSMRGIHKPGARTVTSAVRGLFRRNAASRAEVFSLIRNS